MLDTIKFTLIFMTLILVGCSTDPTKEQVKEQVEEQVNLVKQDDLLTDYQTDAIGVISKWQPNTYYARLYVEPFGMISGIRNCQNMSKLVKGLKSYFGVDDAVGFFVTADINDNTSAIANNILLVSYSIDELNHKGTHCNSETFKGYLSPYFKVNSTSDISITYKINYITEGDIKVLKKLKERTVNIIEYFSPKSVGVLTSSVFDSVINPIDSSIEDSLNISAKDILVSHFKVNTAVGEKRYDGAVLDFGPIFPDKYDISRGIGIDVHLVYYNSVVGIGAKDIIYEDDPIQLLSSLKDSHNKNTSVYKLIKNDDIKGIASSSLKAYKDSDEKQLLSKVCQNIKSYTSDDLGLTSDDALSIRWAILTEFSNYNNIAEIRSEDCFRKSELEMLTRLNRNYYFSSIPELKGNYVQNVTEILGKTVTYDIEDNVKYYDMDNLKLFIKLSEPLPADIAQQLGLDNKSEFTNGVFGGEQALIAFKNILKRARCGRLTNTSPHTDVAFVGLLETNASKPLYVLGGVNITPYGEKYKINTIHIADRDLIRQYISPTDNWPTGQLKGLCPTKEEVDLISGYTVIANK